MTGGVMTGGPFEMLGSINADVKVAVCEDGSCVVPTATQQDSELSASIPPPMVAATAP
jgi:hypothetical protein